jgi:uncharacterized protein YjdB
MHAYQQTTRRQRHALAVIAAAALVGACNQHPVAARSEEPRVTNGQLLKVSVSPASPRMLVGDTITLRAEIRDRFGHMVADLVPVWESTEAAVVIVSPDGTSARVIAIGAGEARVIARAQDALGAASVSVSGTNAPPQW